MKRIVFSLASVIVLTALVGCVTQHGRRPWNCMGGSCAQAPETCQSCNGDDPGRAGVCRECRGRGCDRCRGQAAEAGPPSGTVTYPYYTTRGPRDFLAKNPQSIGP
jgi:hypothetical protein